MVEKYSKRVIFLLVWCWSLEASLQIYIPDEQTQKPIIYTSGIKTVPYRKSSQVEVHHNYSKVHPYPSYDSRGYTDYPSERPYPVYNAHTYGNRPFSERLTQVYVLNGTRLGKNDNPTRRIVIYNKQKRTPKVEVHRSCPRNATGQFVYEASCNQFLNCWKGRGYVQNCAPGTLFNPKTLECDYPDKVYCISGPRQSILQRERSSRRVKQIGCPRAFTGLIPNYTDCSKFINCVSGIENLMDCPPGTLFDVNKNICDFAHKAACFNGQNQKLIDQNIDGKLDFNSNAKSARTHQLGYRTGGVSCPYGVDGLHKHPTDCSKFLNCAHGQTYIQDCAPGTLFNPVVKICDFPYNVRCENNTSAISIIDYDAGYYERNRSRGPGRWNHSSGSSGQYGDNWGTNRPEYHGSSIGQQSGSLGGSGHYYGGQETIDRPGYHRGSAGQQTGSYGHGYNGGQQEGEGQYHGGSIGIYGGSQGRYGQGSGSRDYHGGSASQDSAYGGSKGHYRGSTSEGSGYGGSQGYYGGANSQGTAYGGSEDRYRGSTSQGSAYGGSRGSSSQGSAYGGSENRYRGSSGQGSAYGGTEDRYRGSSSQGSASSGSEGHYRGSDSQGSSYYDTSTIQYSKGGYGSGHYGSSTSNYGNIQYSRPSPSQGSRPHYNQYDQNQYQGSVRPGSEVYGGTSNQYHNGQSGVYSGNSYGSDRLNKGSVGRVPESFGTNQNREIGSDWGQYHRDNKGTNDRQYGGGYDQGQGQGTWGVNQYQGGHDGNQYSKGTNLNHWDQNRHNDGTYDRNNLGTTKTYTNQNNGYDSRPIGQSVSYGTLTNNNWTGGQNHRVQYHGREQDSYGRGSTPRGETGYNRWYGQNKGGTDWNQNRLDEPANYDQVVNINHVRKTTRVPFRNSYEPFYGPTTLKTALSESRDYDDTNVDRSRFVLATTPKVVERSWPPPFPSTDVNADYVFEYDDSSEVTLEAENSVRHQKTSECGKSDFRCSSEKCVPKTVVCDGARDCPDGRDEEKCLQYVSKFSVRKNHKLAVLERERWNNVSIASCALLCVEAQNLQCKAFNYRKIDKTCFLINTNEALTGGLISYYPVDYYELISERINCSKMYVCPNKRCIAKSRLCDGHDDCGDRTDEKRCKPEDFGYRIRLEGSKNKHEGRIEVTAFGKTGYICDDKFGLRDATVACKELGFHMGAAEVKGNSFYGPTATPNDTFYMMDDVTCSGNETRLMDCDFSGWGVHNCLGQEIVGVVCKTPKERCGDDYWQCDTGQECLPLGFVCDGLLDCTDGSDEGAQHCDAPTEFRLVNGSSRQEGRVEIRHHGIWGTVCDDDFNEDAAKVVCKHLGYKGSAIVKKEGFFGAGSGPIWLDQVICSGNETTIENCTHWNWGEHNCDHTEDVGVICSNVYEYERHSSLVPMPSIPQVYPDRCGYRKDNIFNRDDNVHFRVVRGSVAQKGDYPWQAVIRVKGKGTFVHWCGAVIISEKFVLTAAHCLIGYSKGAYIVVAGDYNVDEDEGTEQEAYIEDFYLHEKFRQGHKMNNDIALVKLKGRGFRLNEDVQAICLPDANTNYEMDANCTISGYGSIQSGKSASSHDLRAGWVPLQQRQICTMPHVYGDALTDGMICAGSLDEGVDSCDGDSGGPLACLYNGAFTLYGITSWGQHCGYANKPGVYVKVAHYRKWIDDTFRKYSTN